MPNAKYYWKNVESIKQKNAEYRKKNKKKIKAYFKERLKVKANREKAYAATKKWAQGHPENMRAANLRWRKKNRKRERVRSLKFRNDNIDAYREYDKQYSRENPEKMKAKAQKRRTAKTKAGGSFSATEWKALCEKYKHKCLCCGRKRKLTSDHVIPVSKGGTSNISNIQPLCGPCNSRKRDKTIDYRKGTHAST